MQAHPTCPEDEEEEAASALAGLVGEVPALCPRQHDKDIETSGTSVAVTRLSSRVSLV